MAYTGHLSLNDALGLVTASRDRQVQLVFHTPGEPDRAVLVFPRLGAATLDPDGDLHDGEGRVIARWRQGTWRLDEFYATTPSTGLSADGVFSHVAFR